MQHGMHNAIDLLQFENELRDRKLKYHYLVADERLRRSRPAVLPRLIEGMRSLFAPRPMLTQESGI